MHRSTGIRPRRVALALLSIPLLLAASCTHTPTAEDIKYAQIRYDLGLNEAEQGNVQAALRELQVAVERHPDFAEAHNAMGLLLHMSLRRYDQAEAAYRTALRIRPDFSDAHNNIGALYIDLERYAEAETHFREALDDVLYGTPHIAQGNLGWVLYLQGRPEDAITQLRSAVLVQPKFCQGHRNLGRIYRELGRHDESRASFRHFVRQCPEVAEAQYEWGRIAYEEGDAEEAREAFEACFRLAPDGEIGDVCHRHLEVMASGTGGQSRSEG